MTTPQRVKLFGMDNLMVERDLDRLERDLKLDLGRDQKTRDDKDESYYPQFPEAVRREAAEMAAHYELFYCLERYIRVLVIEKLEAAHGATWWNSAVPQPVKDSALKNMQKEAESGATVRSTKEIDYTTFGELGDIVRANWQTFSDTFNNEKAFSKVMSTLNLLRAPIAHCSALAPDEVVRLKLTLKDWFRLME